MRLLTSVILLALLAGQSSVLAAEMILHDEPPQSTYIGYGFLFLALSGASWAYSQSAAKDSGEKLDKAKAQYASASGSGDTTEQGKATDALQDARVAEFQANVAAYMSLVLLATSYFSFFPNHLPDNTVLTPRGITYNYRF